ncbi:MAG: UvrD-helicase domain-containing protein [Phycisphaerales bacterium]|nr:UvrD-helicase domain-containing protein [Phycisphaerales bacterium]
MMTSDALEMLLEGLTAPQREAVTTTEGAMLILAAAGSGKTRVITRRVAFLIANGVPAWQILAVTFTNKAAGEMRERVEHLLEEHGLSGARGLTLTTFHALCARLLRRYAVMMRDAPRWGIDDQYTIYDTDDQSALMKRVLSELQMKSGNWSPRQVLGTISNAKNQLLGPEEYAAMAQDFFTRTIAKVYEKYQQALRAANAVDFDDLLLMTVRLLRECEAARAEVQGRWKYLMIDEYQDTNRAQFQLASLVVGSEQGQPPRSPNVCVVGDPDQSIYGWRGADISNILEFEEHFPDAKVIALGENFRSTAPILACADALIKHNRLRKDKPLFTSGEGGEKPEVVFVADEHAEARLVADWFRRRVEDEGLAWRDMAVFYRTNALSRVMEDECRKAGIPYVIARGTAFYQREEVRDAISYLRVVANPLDEVSLRRIVNKPSRKIGATSLDAAASLAAMRGIPLFEAMRESGSAEGVSSVAARGMDRFVAMVEGWTGAGSFMGAEVSSSLAELVERVVRESGLESHYKAIAQKSSSDADEARVANLEELVTSAREFELEFDPSADAGGDGRSADVPPLLAMLRAYLESIALVADADQVDPERGAVTLMTLHAAKGLEFPAVAMIGLEEGLLPSARALEEDSDGEEERRLCFVGITRAQRHLLMTSARYRTHRGVPERTIASRFIEELPQDQIRVSNQSDAGYEDDSFESGPSERGGLRYERDEDSVGGLSVGMHARHPQFGIGRVVSFAGLGANRRVIIDFKGVGRKTLILQYARLQVVE